MSKLDKKLGALLAMTFVVGGIFGFVYEVLFYRIDLGYFTKRGTTFGPWIPIYGFGALGIILLAYRFRKQPAKLLAVSCLLSGLIEFSTGYLLFHAFGVRLWDYNVEIWNWGNIGGYICIRSIAVFGLSALLLCHLVYPAFERIYGHPLMKGREHFLYIPAIIFAIDILASMFFMVF